MLTDEQITTKGVPKMEKREDLQNNAILELKGSIISNLSGLAPKESINATFIYNNLVKFGFVAITPPLEEPPMMHFLTMDSLKNYKDGSSIKPGNIGLNIRRLIEAIPEVASIGAGMMGENHFFTICGALSLWMKLRDIATVSISKEQAFVIVALWRNCNDKHKITAEEGFIATNKLLSQYGESSISTLKYNMILDSLTEINCIELIAGTIWLREQISKKYIYCV